MKKQGAFSRQAILQEDVVEEPQDCLEFADSPTHTLLRPFQGCGFCFQFVIVSSTSSRRDLKQHLSVEQRRALNESHSCTAAKLLLSCMLRAIDIIYCNRDVRSTTTFFIPLFKES